jgi:DNA-binding NarL/FixJ family response regulator
MHPRASETRLRVLVVDDHDIVRLGVRSLLADRADIREAGDLPTAARLLAEAPCDLLLLDLALGDQFGLAALPRLRTECPGMRVIVLSSLPEALYAERALKSGADGFVSKSALTGTLVDAVDTVLGGRVHVSAEMRETLLRGVGGSAPSRPDLSPRELEVLHLVAAGRSTREIADALNRSVKTIETHKQSLKTKLGADSPAQLMRMALQWTGDAL